MNYSKSLLVFLGLSVTRSVPRWRETDVWPRRCRSTSCPTPSIPELLQCTVTASRRMPGLSLHFLHLNYSLCKLMFFFLSSILCFRKDLKFVAEVEGEIRNLVELANKVTALMISRLFGQTLWCSAPSGGVNKICLSAPAFNLFNSLAQKLRFSTPEIAQNRNTAMKKWY